jgi:flavin reductase (DIM6/NTAB) family NADH-FMN oxidoreductase RutF
MVELECTWIRLRTGKEFSRLLYPNPVCFLSTTHISTSSVASAASTAHPDKDASGFGKVDEVTTSDWRSQQLMNIGNVMVLSWLTPTNNSGRFMFSIHKSRFTASLLAPPITAVTTEANTTTDHSMNNFITGVEFALSVPTRGMEQIILDTGSLSGRFGSKFSSERGMDRQNQLTTNAPNDIGSVDTISNRKRKKLKRQRLSSQGVAGLKPIPYCDVSDPLSSKTSLFVIAGSVAYMKCRTYGIIGSPVSDKIQAMSDARLQNDGDVLDTHKPIIDHDHLLVMAEVVDALVHPSYWDDKKLLFRPTTDDKPPYLTFLGAQTFGYVKSL